MPPEPAEEERASEAPDQAEDALGSLPQEPPPTRPEPQECRDDLAQAGAVFEVREAIADGVCGAERPLAVSAVGAVRLSGAAILRCDAALALARWMADVVSPSAVLHLGAPVMEIAVGSSYVCRRRRTGGAGSGTLSEHALANAIDISGVVLEDGRRVKVAQRAASAAPERAFQAAIRGGACALFTTVLGPGTNNAHADHLHLDRAYRRGGYRLCQ